VPKGPILGSMLFLLSLGLSAQVAPQASNDFVFPAGTIGLGYTVQLSLDGVELAAPVTVDVTGLPNGLSYDSQTRIISGTPAAGDAIQTYAINITVRDSNAKSLTILGKLALGALNPVTISTTSEAELPDAIEGQPYQATLNLPAGTSVHGALMNFPHNLTIVGSSIQGTPQGNSSDGEYHGQLSLSAGGAVVNAHLKIKLHLETQVLKLSNQCMGLANTAPIVTAAITDLSSTISGLTTVSKGCSAKVTVWTIDPPTTRAASIDYLDRHPTPAQLMAAHANSLPVKSGQDVGADGTFSLQLPNPPRAGQTIVLEEILSDSSQNVISTIFSIPIPVHFAGDWGRVKTYFTSGILLSEDQGSFSQSSLFLSFLLDKTWVLPRPVYAHSNWVPGLDTFFETRLTSAPVTAQPCPAANTTTGGQCTSQSGSDMFNTFLTQQKTARLDVGIYLPFVAKVWTFNGVRNGLFVAPLAKVGFDTPTSPINQSQAQGQSSSAGNTSGTVVVPVNNSNFYNFYAYGGRIGHISLPAPEKARDSDAWAVNEAPELNSYIDVAVGRFSNLQTVLNDGAHTRLYRISLEGLLKVPSTPLAVGFSANLGQTNVGVNTSAIRQKAADDLRFLIGAKFDVNKITTYLTSHAF
jgi:hypothetical protein